jgi:geranylgeranyl diphosphate synthase type II
MVLGKTCWDTTIYPLRAGGLIATRGSIDPTRFDHFGLCLGALFQITDDVQNLEPTDPAYGKELYGDILEGKRTLPLIHLLHHADDRDRREVVAFLGRPRSDRTFVDAQAIHDLMVSLGSVDWARGYAHGLAEDARDGFDETFRGSLLNEHRTFLAELLVFLVHRLG